VTVGVRSRSTALLAAALLAAVVGAGLLAHGQATDPAIAFESPLEGGYASGPMPIRVRLDPPATPVQSVSFVADGRLVCTIERPPFECPWDAGPAVAEHAIRASVLLKDGRRISRTIRTKAETYAETVDVNAMQLTVTVTDSHGRFVRGLTREDFRVYDDDVLQPLSGFAAENVALEIFVAVDVSGSMKAAMPTVKLAVRKFLSALRPTDRVTLVGFNDNVFTLARPTADLATRLAAVDRLSPWGGTALYDVIVKSIDQLGRQTGRRALVVFTDGEDLNSRVPEEAAEQRLESSDAVLYPIGQGRAPKMEALKRVLERLAQKSGGRAFFEDLDELDAAFTRIVEELSNQYLLGYPRPDAAREGNWRKQRVEIPGRDLKIRTRQGYRVAAK
jgi:Ca-activated chloride channel family protein